MMPVTLSDLWVHRPALMRYAMQSLSNWHDAEDAVQDTLLLAWTRRHQYRGEGSVKAWVFAILANQCRMVWRWRGVQPDIRGLEAACHYHDSAPGPDRHLLGRERLMQVVNELSHAPKASQALLLYARGLSYREICERTGRGLGAVKTDIYRGRKYLEGL